MLNRGSTIRADCCAEFDYMCCLRQLPLVNRDKAPEEQNEILDSNGSRLTRLTSLAKAYS